jgi:hypothetical protein
MRIYGYEIENELDEPIEMKEISFVTKPITLRKLSGFFMHVANLMERHGDKFGHEHFNDFDKTIQEIPQITISMEKE